MRTLESATQSWQELKQYRTIQDLREAVRIDGHTSAAASAGLRSSCWKAFLLFESVDTASWPKTLASSRSAYNSLRTHFLRHVENPDELEGEYDPLSEQAESSPWAGLRKDEELRAEIQQDVDRCMPENLYFRQPDTQRMLLDVLFVFCKLNPDVGYRQGMHELLAPILWVIERDAIDLGPSSRALGEEAVVRTVYDAEHIEHDSFALFIQVMHSAKNFYEQTTHSGKENPMVLRSKRIFSELLPQIDPELAQHLEHVDLVPQIFLMRWIRLLFGREFAFDDMLMIWDVIFAEDPTLELVDYICLAMMLRIRWELIDADYNSALTLLLRYPEPGKYGPAQTFALDALYLRDHQNTDGSGYLVLKYTGQPMLPRDRPVTPPALQRNITAFSGVLNALPSPSGRASSSGRQRRGRDVESLLQSTAKNIYARGRGALDEVHKRAQEIRDTQAPSLPPRPTANPSGPGALYSRVKALEERNKQLSGLLEGAVDSLWEYQRVVTEQDEARSTTPGASREGENVEKLSLAIAKVQFVQVYLADATLPLPEPELEAQEKDRTGGDDEVAEKGDTEDGAVLRAESARSKSRVSSVDQADEQVASKQRSPVPIPTTSSTLSPDTAEQLADPSTFEDEEAQTPLSGEQQVPAMSAHVPATIRTEEDTEKASPVSSQVTGVSPPGSRPPLAESAYSWMLGQDDSTKQPFARANSVLPEQGRSRGFLFGGGKEGEKAGGSPSRRGRGGTHGQGTTRQGKHKHKADAEAVGDDVFDLNTLSSREADK